MRSSYKKNNYGNVLSALVIGKAPKVCVELGVLDGYSTVHIAKALKINERAFGVDGRLDCWDLFDQYKYNHGCIEDVKKELDNWKVTPFVQIFKGDAFEAPQLYRRASISFLHVDLSNTGATLRKVMQFWSHRLKPYGMIAFEGGSKERDEVDWMVKYNKKPIREELENNEVIQSQFEYFVFQEFPSLTILQKKGIFTR